MKTEISIAIITKNRKKELEKCLDSISLQTQKDYQIIIIDNDSNFSAKKTINKKKYAKLNFSYYYGQGTVPKCRNLAINLARTKYLGFVDDDCILNKDWLEKGKKEIIKNDVAYVLGKTLLLNPQNIIALGQFARDDYWKDYNSKIFDTKNVIINLNLIKNIKLHFDENCQKDAFDSADFDFDFQLKKSKLKGIFCSEMMLFHKETSNFKRFKYRAYYRGYLARYLNKKWKLKDGLVDLRTKNFLFWFLKAVKDFKIDFVNYSEHMQASFYKRLLATFVIKLFERYYIIGYVSNQKNK
jgi:glycosyltransferase involved in cell wall biosynthesis